MEEASKQLVALGVSLELSKSTWVSPYWVPESIGEWLGWGFFYEAGPGASLGPVGTGTAEELDRAVALLDQLPSVRRLSILIRGFHDEDFQRFAPLADQIESLDLLPLTEFSGNVLEEVAEWKMLKELNINMETYGLKGEQIRPLVGLESLEELYISIGNRSATHFLDEETFVALAEFPQLRSLTLDAAGFDGRWLAHMQASSSLRELHLRDCQPFYEGTSHKTDEGWIADPSAGEVYYMFRVGNGWPEYITSEDVQAVAKSPFPDAPPRLQPPQFPLEHYRRWLREQAPGVQFSEEFTRDRHFMFY